MLPAAARGGVRRLCACIPTIIDGCSFGESVSLSGDFRRLCFGGAFVVFGVATLGCPRHCQTELRSTQTFKPAAICVNRDLRPECVPLNWQFFPFDICHNIVKRCRLLRSNKAKNVCPHWFKGAAIPAWRNTLTRHRRRVSGHSILRLAQNPNFRVHGGKLCCQVFTLALPLRQHFRKNIAHNGCLA